MISDGLRAGFDGYIPDLLDAFKSAKSVLDIIQLVLVK